MSEQREHVIGEHGKCVRVEIEWEDGSVQTVTGAQAEQYIKQGTASAMLAWNHGMPEKPLDWRWSRSRCSDPACGHAERFHSETHGCLATGDCKCKVYRP